MSEREYAAHTGLSRGAIQKAKNSGPLVLHADGSIDAAASDARRAAATDPSKSRAARKEPMKPVPDNAVSAVGDTLREHGLAAPATGGGMTFLQAKTANEVLKAQERKLRLAKLKGELVERDRASDVSDTAQPRSGDGFPQAVGRPRAQRRCAQRKFRSTVLPRPSAFEG